MSTPLCRKCGTRPGLWDGLCGYCNEERKRERREREEQQKLEKERYWEERNRRERELEYQRERDREEDLRRERELELQEEAAEEAAKAARDAAEARRIASLKTYTCCHCKGTFNEEQGKSAVQSPIKEPLCDDCYKTLKLCKGCGSYFFLDDTTAKISPIEIIYKEDREEAFSGTTVKKETSSEYACAGCRKTKLKKFFDSQEKLKRIYEEEEAERKKNEELDKQQEEACLLAEKIEEKKKQLEKEEKKAKESRIKIALDLQRIEISSIKNSKDERLRALAFGCVVLAFSALFGQLTELTTWSVPVGVVILLLSLFQKTVASDMLFGLVFALIPNAITAIIMGFCIGFGYEVSHGITISISLVLWMILGATMYPGKVTWKNFSTSFSLLFNPIRQTAFLFVIVVSAVSYASIMISENATFVAPVISLCWFIVVWIGAYAGGGYSLDWFASESSYGIREVIRLGASLIGGIIAGYLLCIVISLITGYDSNALLAVMVLLLTATIRFIWHKKS